MVKNKTKENFDVVTVGGATRDITFYTDKGKIIPTPKDPLVRKIFGFEYGAKINIGKAYFMFGGGASNTAVSCGSLGLKTACVVRVGNDENGRLMLDNLRKRGVNTNLVQIDRRAESGFSFIISTLKSREHTAFLYRGANDNLQLTTNNLQRLNTNWLYISSLTGKNWKENLNKVFLTPNPKRPTPKYAWNPGNLQLKEGKGGLGKFLKLTDVLILNKDEATELALSHNTQHVTRNKIKNIKNLLETLKLWGPKMVVITQGAKGAYVYNGQKIYYAGIYKTKRVDTTGAGDAFGSSFIAGLILYKNNIEKSLRLAIANSGFVITRIGAQNGLLKRKQAEKVMERIKIKIYK